MAGPKKSPSPGRRLQRGASVLSAARVVDTRLVKDRLQRFEQAHRSYAAAQRTVEAVESQLEAAQARVLKLDAVQDHAVEVLARKIANAGHGRRANPFAAFGAPSPSVISRLPLTDEPDAVGRLVAAVLRNGTVGKEVIEAAQAADKAARAVKQALAPAATLEASLLQARQKRDAIGQVWESALAALRRGTRAAADDGAPHLHATLFPSATTRASGKTKPAQDAPATPTTSNAA